MLPGLEPSDKPPRVPRPRVALVLAMDIYEEALFGCLQDPACMITISGWTENKEKTRQMRDKKTKGKREQKTEQEREIDIQMDR